MQRTEEVQRLQEQGCTILCLDCPEGTLFGIDYSAWSVGPRFMGVKLVPPGLHYVYSAGSAEDVGISRSGFFLYMKPKDVAVFRWDKEAEELVRPDCLDEEARYADGARSYDFDSHLGPYPLELATQWAELTRHASPKIVSKIEPVSKVVRSKRAEYDAAAGAKDQVEAVPLAMMDANLEAPEGPLEGADDDVMGTEIRLPKPDSAPPTDPRSEATIESNQGIGCLFFSSLPRFRKRTGATPAETTSLHLDQSGRLEEMIRQEYGGNEMGVLGELQLAYIAFLLGQNYDGFEQWRALLTLLCSCEKAAAARPELFAELCRVFFAQLSQAPSDLFGDDLTRDNFMGSCALSLLEICDTEEAPMKLRKRCAKLRELVQEKFGISMEDLALLGEDAPVVVDEDGRDLIDLGGSSLIEMD